VKSEKLLDALGKIDDELVLEVMPAAVQTKKKRRWPMWLAAAAMVALCFFGAYKLGLQQKPQTGEPLLQDQPEEEPPQEVETPADPTAEAVRQYLRGFTPSNSHEIVMEDARAVLTDYIRTHGNEFRYLPAFRQGFNADWDDLTLFVLMVGGFDNTLTEAELEQTVAAYLDQKITHKSSAELQHENGLYTVLARGIADNPVFYCVESVICTTSNVFEIKLAGVEFWTEDLLEQTQEHSKNWELLQSLCGDLTPENLETRIYDQLRNYGIGAFRVSERVTVRVRLQEGDHPFHYLSCTREQIEVPQFSQEDYEALREKLYALPYAYGWDPGSRHAFLNFFMDDPYMMEEYGHWDMVSLERKNILGEVMDVLTCHGPLHARTGESQCFLYSHETGEVTIGASGIWEAQEYDAAEAVRRTLLNETGDYGESVYIREAFALYHMENPEVLEKLEDFGETDYVCYALQDCRMEGSDKDTNTVIVTLSGIGFTAEDWTADSSKWSYNRKKLEELAGPVDESNYREKLLPYLYETDPLLTPFQITEQARLTMVLRKTGDAVITVHGERWTEPFWYIGWSRTECGPLLISVVEDDFRKTMTGSHVGWYRDPSVSEDTVNVLFRFNAPANQFVYGPLEPTENSFAVNYSFFVQNRVEVGELQVLEIKLQPQTYAYGCYVVQENGQRVSYALSLDQFGKELVVMELQ